MIGNVHKNSNDPFLNGNPRDFTNTVFYLAGKKNGQWVEKCTLFKTLNMVSAETVDMSRPRAALPYLNALISEMNALSFAGTATKPRFHFSLSWPKEEIPGERQIEEAVLHCVKELGVANCQVIYAVHEDTEHKHLHICVNRNDIYTEKAVRINGGWTKKAVEKCCREIELKQGWRIVPGTLYDVENREVVAVEEQKNRKGKTKKKAHYEELKEANEALVDGKHYAPAVFETLETSASWEEFIRGLKKKDFHIRRKGSGLMLLLNGSEYKASEVHRMFSKKNLEAKFGPWNDEYVQSLQEQQPTEESAARIDIRLTRRAIDEETESQPTVKKSREQRYREIREAYFTKRNDMRKEMFRRHREERAKVQNELKEEKRNLRKTWKKSMKSTGINEEMNRLAYRYALMLEELRKRQDTERQRFYLSYPALFPSFAKWQTGESKSIIGNTCYTDRDTPMRLTGSSDITTLGQFKQTKEQSRTVFRKDEDNALIDYGRQIKVEGNNAETLTAALFLAQAKYGGVYLHGTPEFVQKCCTIAVKQNIWVRNPELQRYIQTLKTQRTPITSRHSQRAF